MSGDATGIGDFFAAWELFREPAITGTVAGALLGVIGVYVVVRRMVFLSAAVSQAAGLGVSLAFLLHVPPTLGSAVFTLAAVGLVAAGRGAGLPRDSLLGMAYLVGAAGAVAVGTRIVEEIQDIHTVLFGSAVAVVPEDFRLVIALGAALLLLHVWWWRGFTAVSYDRDGARVRGMPVRLLTATLFVSLALAISVATRVVGALPTFAFSVLPAMAALRLAPNVPTALVSAGLVGAAVGFSGYLVAFVYQLPVGAAQALVGAAVVALAEVARRVLRRILR